MPRFGFKSPGFALLAGMSALSSSCWFRHSPVAFTPPPPRSQPRVAASPPPQLPPPPQIAADQGEVLPPDIPTSIPALAAPPAPRPQQKKTLPVATPKPTPAPPTETPVQPPRLVQLFTPEQEREYNRAIEENLERVRKDQAILSRKNLSPDQTEAVTRIIAFQKQAEEARQAHDLAGADLLARRAATLADDLLTRVP